MTEMEFETSMPGAIVVSALVVIVFTFMVTSVGEVQQKKIKIDPSKNLDEGLTKVLSDVQHCYGTGLAFSNIFVKSLKRKCVGLNCSLFCANETIDDFKSKITRKVARYEVHENENIHLDLSTLPEKLEAYEVYQVYLKDTGLLGKLSRITGGSVKIKIRKLEDRNCSEWEEND